MSRCYFNGSLSVGYVVADDTPRNYFTPSGYVVVTPSANIAYGSGVLSPNVASLNGSGAVTGYVGSGTAPAQRSTVVGVGRAGNVSLGTGVLTASYPLRTNYVVHSEESETFYNVGVVIGVNAAIAPDGQMTADGVTDTATSGSHLSGSAVAAGQVAAGVAFTTSVFVKADSLSWVQVQDNNWWANFNVAVGTIGMVGNATTASIQAVGNGWYRCAITVTPISGTYSYPTLCLLQEDVATASYIGTGQRLFVWGWQRENAPAPTDYIKTGATAASAPLSPVVGVGAAKWAHAVLDPARTGTGIVLSNGYLTATNSGSALATTISTPSVGIDQMYVEAAFGVLAAAASSGIGFANASFDPFTSQGVGDVNSFGLWGGTIYYNATTAVASFDPAPVAGDIIAVGFQRSSNLAGFRNVTQNGAWVFFDISGLGSGPLYLGLTFSPADQATVNFAGPFVGAIPGTGFTTWDGTPIITASIGTGALTTSAATLTGAGTVADVGTFIDHGSALFTFSNNNLTATKTGGNGSYASVLSQTTRGATKVYAELRVDVMTGTVGWRIGPALNSVAVDGVTIGQGSDSYGWIIGLGYVYHNGAIVGSADSLTGSGSRLFGIAVDRIAHTLQYRDIGAGKAWSPPTTISDVDGSDLALAVQCYYVGDQFTFNFDGVFAGAPPSIASYTRWDGSPFTALVATGTGALVAGPASHTNYLPQSQNLEAWSKLASTVSVDAAVAPNGSTTAEIITDDATTNFHGVGIGPVSTPTAISTYTYSIHVKAGTLQWVQLMCFGAANANFGLAAGTKGLSSGSLLATNITDAGNGWWRCSMTFATASAPALYVFALPLDQADYNYTGTGSGTILAWGGQVELGAAPSAYIQTTTAAVTAVDPVLSGVGTAVNPGVTGTGALVASYGSGGGGMPADVIVNIDCIGKTAFVRGTGAVGIETLFGTDERITHESTAYHPDGFTSYGYDPTSASTFDYVAFIGPLLDAVLSGKSVVLKCQSHGGITEDWSAYNDGFVVNFYRADGEWFSTDCYSAIAYTDDPLEGYAELDTTNNNLYAAGGWRYSLDPGNVNVVAFSLVWLDRVDFAGNDTFQITAPLLDSDSPAGNSIVCADLGPWGPLASITVYDTLSLADLRAKTVPELDAAVGGGAVIAPLAGVGVSESVALGALTTTISALSAAGKSISTGTAVLPGTTAALTASGTSRSVGTSVLTDGAATLAGAGLSTGTGTGTLSCSVTVLAAAGKSISTGTVALNVSTATLVGIGASVTVVTGSGVLSATSATVAALGKSTSIGSGALPPVAAGMPADVIVNVDFIGKTGFVRGTGAVGIETLIGQDARITAHATEYHPDGFTQYGYDPIALSLDPPTLAFLGPLLDAALSSKSVVLKCQSNDSGYGWAGYDGFSIDFYGAHGTSFGDCFVASNYDADNPIGHVGLDTANNYIEGPQGSWVFSNDPGQVNSAAFSLVWLDRADLTGNNFFQDTAPLLASDNPANNPVSCIDCLPQGPLTSITVYDTLSLADLKAKTVPELDAPAGAGGGLLTSTVVGVGLVQSGVAGTGVLAGTTAAASGAGVSSSQGTIQSLSATLSVSSGSGVTFWVLTGTLTANTAALSGAGVSAWIGTGALADQTAALVGSGVTRWVASGALAASTPSSILGAGTASYAASGALSGGAAGLVAVGTSSSTATGSLLVGAAAISGFEGVTIISGAGTLPAQVSQVGALALSRSQGTGVLPSGAGALYATGSSQALGAGAIPASSAALAASGTSASSGLGALTSGVAGAVGSGVVLPAVTGTGTLVAGAATLFGVQGVVVIQGQGDLHGRAAQVAAPGVTRSIGAGALLPEQPVLAAVGLVQAVGTGALAGSRSTATGTGGGLSLGSGAAGSGPSLSSGTGYSRWVAVGFLPADLSRVASVGVSGLVGSGVLKPALVAVAGAGTVLTTGSGVLAVQTAHVFGSAHLSTVGTGDVGAQAATVVAAGLSFSRGSGALHTGAVTLAGAGVEETTGSGTLSARTARLVGAGVQRAVGSGDLAPAVAGVAAVGISRSTGSAPLHNAAAEITAAGTSATIGNGMLAAKPAHVFGGGVEIAFGSGDLVAQDHRVVAVGVARSYGTGALRQDNAALDAQGVSSSRGQGTLPAKPARIIGFAVETAYGSGDLQLMPAMVSGDDLVVGDGAIAAAASVVVGAGNVGQPTYPEPTPMPGGYPGTLPWYGGPAVAGWHVHGIPLPRTDSTRPWRNPGTGEPILPPPPWWNRAA